MDEQFKINYHIWPAPVRIYDARYRPVRLFIPDSMANLQSAGLDPAILAQAKRSIWRSITPGGWVIFVMNLIATLGPGFYGILHVARSDGEDLDTVDWVLVSISAFFLIFGFPFAWSKLRNEHAILLRRRFLACQCCASCGYSLRALTPEPDGCTVCPECSAAWHLDK